MRRSPILHMVLASAVLVGVLTAGTTAWAGKCPNVMFVLDRSGSMSSTPGAGQTKSKWTLLVEAVATILKKYGDQLPFGMSTYTSSGSSDAVCYQNTVIEVEPDHDTAKTINSKLATLKPDSGTNTAQAIRRARENTKMKDPSRGQFIILITDGDPNCPYDDATSAMYTCDEITKGTKQPVPIHTFVIGFDGTSGVNPANLDRMAKAGLEARQGCVGAPASPCYYSASDAQKLNDALDKIVNQISGGEFGQTACDDSCFSVGCPTGQRCTTDEFDPKPHCVNDPCYGVTNCAAGDYCRNGQCVHACLTACKAGQRCVDGNCVSDPCYSAKCAAGQTCDPNTGGCVLDQCEARNITCPPGLQCNKVTGQCGTDPCTLINCPSGTVCKPGGNCESLQGGGGQNDGGTGPTTGRATVGCTVSPAGDVGGTLGALAALVMLAALVRRRR